VEFLVACIVLAFCACSCIKTTRCKSSRPRNLSHLNLAHLIDLILNCKSLDIVWRLLINYCWSLCWHELSSVFFFFLLLLPLQRNICFVRVRIRIQGLSRHFGSLVTRINRLRVTSTIIKSVPLSCIDSTLRLLHSHRRVKLSVKSICVLRCT